MAKIGENLTPEFFTFKYPGREPKFLEEFLAQRPDILEYKIFDLNLTSGRLLYLAAPGGIGFTKEPHISKMHEWIRTSTSTKTLIDEYEKRYGEAIGKWKYHRLREVFNEEDKDLPKWTSCARLYLLWMGSNFTQRYRKDGYDGVFFPREVDFELFRSASIVNRVKLLGFEKKDIFSFKDGLVDKNTVLYSHLPTAFGTYGAGWVWNKPNLDRFIRVTNELAEMGYNVLISSQFSSRGRVKLDYRPLFPGFTHLEIKESFKESKTFANFWESEMYMFNF
jgi:hypothetical protein